MVRKQLYITEEQERALKERARVEGVAEAEIVRTALDRHLYPRGPGRPRAVREQALADLLKGNEELSRHIPRDAPRPTREDLYREREDRLIRKLDR